MVREMAQKKVGRLYCYTDPKLSSGQVRVGVEGVNTNGCGRKAESNRKENRTFQTVVEPIELRSNLSNNNRIVIEPNRTVIELYRNFLVRLLFDSVR